MHADLDMETGEILIQGSDFLIRPKLTLRDLSGTRFGSYFISQDTPWYGKNSMAFKAREPIEICGTNFFLLIFAQGGSIYQMTLTYCPLGVKSIGPGFFRLISHIVERSFATFPVYSLDTEYNACLAWLKRVTGSDSATHFRPWGYLELVIHREREFVLINVTYK